MFKGNLFWSDHFEIQAHRRKKRPDRLVKAAKWVAHCLVAMAAGLLLVLLLLRWLPLPTSAFMLWHRLNGNPVHYHWVPMEKISPELAIAAVASEDQRFPEHWGIDFKAISNAIEDNKRRSRPRGASTISQQVTKNLFLWSGKSLLRKGMEASLTVAVELCWSKRRILEVYLNIAQFGPDTFGADAASRKIFGLAPSQLNGYQSALLVSVLPNPQRYRALPATPYISQRAAEIQEQVRLLGGRTYLSEVIE